MSSELSTTYWNLVLAVALLVAVSTVWSWRQRKMAVHLFIWAVVAFAVIIGWGLSSYYAQQAEKGIVVCDEADPTDCIIAMHIHTYLYGSVCGVDIELPREEGSLSNVHTHKEENRLHWHERLPWDAKSNKLLDESTLELGPSFEKISFELTDSCVKVQNGLLFCNGDSCPGSSTPGKLRVWRHYDHDTDTGEEMSTWQNVKWEDEESYKVVFG